MIIYIALVKSTSPLGHARLIINDNEKEFKARLATIPKRMIETIASYDMQSNLTRYYSISDYLA